MTSEYVLVETNEGEQLFVLNDDNSGAGYDIEKFLAIIDIYCNRIKNNEKLEEYETVSQLEQHFQNGLCEETQSIRDSYYYGDWDLKGLRENEYDVFMSRLAAPPPVPFSEDDYRKTVQAINHKWRDIDVIIEMVDKILKVLRNVEIEDVAELFDLEETKQSFDKLLGTLQFLERRGASFVRLNIL